MTSGHYYLFDERKTAPCINLFHRTSAGAMAPGISNLQLLPIILGCFALIAFITAWVSKPGFLTNCILKYSVLSRISYNNPYKLFIGVHRTHREAKWGSQEREGWLKFRQSQLNSLFTILSYAFVFKAPEHCLLNIMFFSLQDNDVYFIVQLWWNGCTWFFYTFVLLPILLW